MKMIVLATFVALTLVGTACGGGGGGGGIPPAPEGFSKSEWATYVAKAAIPRPTPDAKATAMAKAIWSIDSAPLCNDPRCFSPEEQAALRSSLVLKMYGMIIGDTEVELRAEALYQETKAAWEAAHVPTQPQPIIIVRPLAPQFPAPSDTFELDRLKHKVNELCREIGESVC